MVSESEENSIGQAVSFPSTAGGLTFIEQLQILSLEPCTKLNTPYLIGVNQDERKTILSKAACKCWNCETCAARNAKTWLARVINGCNKLSHQWSLLTLTSHRKRRKRYSVLCLREGWKKFYNRILAKFEKTAKGVFYVRVWEQHKDGSFHIHILININLGTRWAKNNARRCGMGHQADWRDIENAGQAAGYVAKYTLKNATIARGGILWPKGLRRIETSRNWPKLPEKDYHSGFTWSISNGREFQSEIAGKLQLEGYEVIDLTPKSVL